MTSGTIFPSPTSPLPLDSGGQDRSRVDPIYSEIDPGAVGAGRQWIVVSTGAGFVRNPGNTAWVSVGGVGVALQLSNTAAAETIGNAGTGGAAGTASRGDHVHAMPAAGAPTAEALGSTQATGAAGTFADSAHRHAMPAKSVAVPLVASGAGAAGTSANPSLDDHVHPLGSGELDYAQITAPVNVTATTEATANTLITGGAVTYDGATVVMIEAFLPAALRGTSLLQLWLYDGAASIGAIGLVGNFTTGESWVGRRRLTPSAAAHTYSLRASVDGGTGVATGGAGGVGNYVPAFMRITRA
jgi:hypothetical protein